MENAAERRQSKKSGKDIPGNSPCHGRAVGRRHTGGRKIKMVVKIKEINEILRDSEDIKITYDSKTHEFKVSLYDLSADFIVKSIAGRTIDASLADIKRYLSKPWYLPATWIKEIVKE